MLRSILVAALVSATFVMGQTPAGKAGVTGTGAFTVFVENMDRTLAFYHDAFGMEVPALPASGARPYNAPNPQMNKFLDITGSKERHQSARIPGTRLTVDVMEVQEIPHQTIQLRLQDPGNATLVLMVRDVDAMLARAVQGPSQTRATVVTPGGKPVVVRDGRAVLIRDGDGRFIELRQPMKLPDGTGDIFDLALSLTVNNLQETKQVYREVLGFQAEGDSRVSAMRNLTGLTSAEVFWSRAQLPGSPLWIEFVEYKGVERTPLKMKIQDRGAARLQLRVQDVDATVAAVNAAGLRVMSEGGVAQPMPPNLKGVLVADPNNFFLTPYASCDGCAPLPGAGKGK